MREAATIAAIRSVHDAAKGLTLACTEIVGPIDMALGVAGAPGLGRRLPDTIRSELKKIEIGKGKSDDPC